MEKKPTQKELIFLSVATIIQSCIITQRKGHKILTVNMRLKPEAATVQSFSFRRSQKPKITFQFRCGNYLKLPCLTFYKKLRRMQQAMLDARLYCYGILSKNSNPILGYPIENNVMQKIKGKLTFPHLFSRYATLDDLWRPLATLNDVSPRFATLHDWRRA